MSDRSDFYYRHKVKESELDQAFNDLEVADRNLAKDIGTFGVIEGGVVTENSPQAFNVLVSASTKGYDQAGQRIFFAPQQTLDCTVDRDGSPTLPSAGNKRILMVTLAFDRLLDDLRTDGNGASVYYRRLESFALYITAGAETTGTPSPPSGPSDELILADITILDTTTVITNSDINYDRAQAFVYTTAPNIGINSSLFTKIDNTVTNVYAAFASVDTELISRNDDGEIDQDLIPDDDTLRDLGASTHPWGEVWAAGSIRHDGSGTPDLGDTGNPYNEVFADTVTAGTVGADTVNIDTAIMPVTGDELIGDSGANEQFTGHFENLSIYTALLAAAGGETIGDGTNQFVPHLKTVRLYDAAIAGALKMSAVKALHRRFPLGNPSQLMTSIVWDWNRTLTLWARTLGNTWKHNATGPGSYAIWTLPGLPDGVKITSVDWTYGIEVTSGAVTANAEVRLFKQTGTGETTTIASNTTFNTTGAWQDDVSVQSGLSESVDMDTYTYFIEVRSAGTAGDITTHVVGFRIGYDADDIGKAALGG
jgi:hypothetical protein